MSSVIYTYDDKPEYYLYELDVLNMRCNTFFVDK